MTHINELAKSMVLFSGFFLLVSQGGKAGVIAHYPSLDQCKMVAQYVPQVAGRDAVAACVIDLTDFTKKK